MLGSRYGVCGSQNGYPDGVYMKQSKLGWIRSLVLNFSTFEAMYDQVPNTTNIAVVLTGETQGLNNDFWSDDWRERFTSVVTEFCERFYKKVRLIEFTNEWDFWDNEDRNIKAVEIAVLGTSICARYGILGVLGSVASSNWVIELGTACKRLDAIEQQVGYRVVHGFAFHPYVSYVQRDGSFTVPSKDGGADTLIPASGWDRLRDKVRLAISTSGGRACALTELGIKIGDAGGAQQQSLYVHGVFQDELASFSADELLMATYFCWCDQNGAPSERGDAAFGLIDEQGKLRPAYRAATYQFVNAPMVDIPVDRLLREGRALTPPEPIKIEPGQGQETPTEPSGSGEPTPPEEATTTTGASKMATMSIEEAHQTRWQAIVHNAPYNHTFGFEAAWRNPTNTWWGAPLTENESTLEDGRPVRVFANAVVAYNSDGSTEVLS